ncbi:DEAD/DEAH box helicase [Streptosporangium saharense]|uniref:AAA family ATPase n=1 Tax=Streptosporangium saharense TaxID=1706840 RepID=A0A7W7QRL1_9ACTN|nr:AAA domain-containing protein [Streptosporangium saharense]MBB4918470.1 hypothetical protein [Streptosporangium saharense]
MTSVPVFLPGPVAVVPSEKVYARLAPHTNPLRLIEEMGRLAWAGALPARIEDDPGRLVVYTDTHVAWLFVTQRGDAYRLGSASLRGFRDEERLLRGALLLQSASGWFGFHQLRDIPPGRMSAHWPLLRHAWQNVNRTEERRPLLPPHHDAYLDLMTRVIDAGRDIEDARQQDAPPIHYRRKESTREERYSARGVYAFRLLRPAPLTVGSMVYLADQPDLRGRVRRINGTEVVVRFETAVDYGRIPAQGSFMVASSDRVFRAQSDAVETLRRTGAVNPGLLTQLVDRRLTPYRTDPGHRPRGALDPDSQLSAFQRALAVPDLLLILGPPGTGKTRTITEIAVACTARQERVLVTSHTNRAVDNVLEQLPEDLFVVRVGNEDTVTGRARGLMVEKHFLAMRERILAATEGTASRLAVFGDKEDVAGRWLAHLGDALTEIRTAEREEHGHTVAFDEVVRRLAPALAERITAAGSRMTSAHATVERLTARARGWERRHTAARDRSNSGILAFLHRWLAGVWQGRLEVVLRELASVREELAQAETALDAERAEAERECGAHPEASRVLAVRDAARRRCEKATADASGAVRMIRTMIETVVPSPYEPMTDREQLTDPAVYDRLARTLALFRARAGILAEWRSGIGDVELDLQRELVRYADVVAATCIGTATAKLLADLEFDLVIVDEAGQISTPNLLVPLVRGRRTVLVGDHQQLPPYLDEEVRAWGDGLAREGTLPPAAAREVGELLSRSAFERLYGEVPPEHRVMLTMQRRMPREIGEFVSAAFYDGVLRTDHPGWTGDPVFTSPFAMVDTSDRPVDERCEEPDGRGSDGNRRGYVNALEADLVVRLVTEYTRYYQDWAVIVPYRAQAERIRAGLARTLGDSTEVADNVGTVDSFQGGERDLIVYAFTRSNTHGDVGFLKELRRLNVAVSRAKRQLVLVGDVATLSAARDEGFRRLMRQMLDHLRRVGDLRPSAEVAERLGRLDDGEV